MAKKLFCLINRCENYLQCSIMYLLLEKDANIYLKNTAYNMKKKNKQRYTGQRTTDD